MVRNLTMLNSAPFQPLRCCRNSTGPPSATRMTAATNAISGSSTIVATRATMTSTARLTSAAPLPAQPLAVCNGSVGLNRDRCDAFLVKLPLSATVRGVAQPIAKIRVRQQPVDGGGESDGVRRWHEQQVFLVRSHFATSSNVTEDHRPAARRGLHPRPGEPLAV